MSRKGVKNGEGKSVSTLAREPVRESKSVFSLPTRLGGVEDLRELVSEYGGIDRVAHDFKLGADLLNRYLVGQIEAPFSLYVALWWQTSSGFRQGFAEAHWTHNYNSFIRKQAEAKARYLETVLEHAVQLLEHRADACELARQLLARSSDQRYSRDPLAGVGSSI